MSSSAYIPQPGSVAYRVLDWFQKNPEEELTEQDIVSKFGIARASVSGSLKPAVDKGVLQYLVNDDAVYVYTLSADHKSLKLRLAEAKPDRPSMRARGAVKLPPSALDFSVLKPEKGVPLVGKSLGEAGVSKWAPLFAMLTEPDMSVEFPAEWKTAVAAQSTKLNVQHHKAQEPTRYKVRLTGDGKARVWRVA
jgi:hypothetical protein